MTRSHQINIWNASTWRTSLRLTYLHCNNAKYFGCDPVHSTEKDNCQLARLLAHSLHICCISCSSVWENTSAERHLPPSKPQTLVSVVALALACEVRSSRYLYLRITVTFLPKKKECFAFFSAQWSGVLLLLLNINIFFLTFIFAFDSRRRASTRHVLNTPAVA